MLGGSGSGGDRGCGSGDKYTDPNWKPRRGGQKAKKQKELAARFAKGEHVPKGFVVGPSGVPVKAPSPPPKGPPLTAYSVGTSSGSPVPVPKVGSGFSVPRAPPPEPPVVRETFTVISVDHLGQNRSDTHGSLNSVVDVVEPVVAKTEAIPPWRTCPVGDLSVSVDTAVSEPPKAKPKLHPSKPRNSEPPVIAKAKVVAKAEVYPKAVHPKLEPTSEGSGAAESSSSSGVATLSAPVVDLSRNSPEVKATSVPLGGNLEVRFCIDFNGVSNTSAAGGQESTGFHPEAIRAILECLQESSSHRVGVCSYIGLHGTYSQARRSALKQAVIDLNTYLSRNGIPAHQLVSCVVTNDREKHLIDPSVCSSHVDDKTMVLSATRAKKLVSVFFSKSRHSTYPS